METYAKILMIAGPTFFALVLLEKWYGWYFKKESFKSMDTISSMSSGFTNTVKDVLKLGFSIFSYGFMVKYLAVYEVKSTFWTYAIAFVALDFAGYVGHAINHKVNFFWNQHLVHHSSEEFNLACALRQSISNLINLFTIFLLPAALLGVSPQVIAIVAPLHLFLQFWYHTVHIGKLGFLEKIIVTPSHHRVHHAINPEYLDKNHGQIFIFWDKLFGTFQEELDDVPPVYGITRPVRTWNPIKINFQHFWLMCQDAWRTSNWLDKFRVWWMPTGWRPADVAEKFPVFKIENPYNFEKYAPKASKQMIIWAWVQFMATFGLLFFFYAAIAKVNATEIMIYGFFIFLMVYAYSELMDRNPNALYWEIAKNLIGLGILYYFGSWFAVDEGIFWVNYLIGGYFIISFIITFLFVHYDIRKDVEQKKMALA